MYRSIPEDQNKKKLAKKAREEANAKGEEFYITGRPCKRGHYSPRLTKDASCKECIETYRKRMRHTYFIKCKYKLEPEEYQDMLQAQNFVCAICKRPETALNIKGEIRTLAVDHCHTTEKVRGLLCNGCNTSIGKFNHDPRLLREAALYCEKQ